MKALLDTNSPKYLRRLVREINKRLVNKETVYCIDNIKTYSGRNFAELEKEKVYSVCFSNGCGTLWVTSTRGYIYSSHFYDSNGQEIVASRE